MKAPVPTSRGETGDRLSVQRAGGSGDRKPSRAGNGGRQRV